jgi:hypothetical protein
MIQTYGAIVVAVLGILRVLAYFDTLSGRPVHALGMKICVFCGAWVGIHDRVCQFCGKADRPEEVRAMLAKHQSRSDRRKAICESLGIRSDCPLSVAYRTLGLPPDRDSRLSALEFRAAAFRMWGRSPDRTFTRL